MPFDPDLVRKEAKMDCDKVWDLLSIYADGEADPSEAAIVEDHVAVCSDCARGLAFMQTTVDVLSCMEEVEPPSSLRASIFAATIERVTLRQRIAAAFKTLAPMPVRYGALAGAAGLLLAFALHNGVNTLSHPARYAPAPNTMASNPPVTPFTPENSEVAPPPVREQIIPNIGGAVPVPGKPIIKQGERNITPSGGVKLVSVSQPALGIQPAAKLNTGAVKGNKKPAPVNPVQTADFKVKVPMMNTVPDDDMPDMEEMMVKAMDPMAADMSAKAHDMDPMTKEAVAATTTASTHYTLISNSSPDISGQAASLADLKRSLRNRNLDDMQAIEKSIKARQIRVPVFKGSF
jgi:hypothetical protein